MLHKLELFLIKFTIPILLHKKILASKLPKDDYAKLQIIVNMNSKLISGLSLNRIELFNIRNYFLSRIETITGEDNIKLLPSHLRDVSPTPSLKSLVISHLRNKMIKNYERHKNEKRKSYLWKTLNILPEEIKEEMKNEFDHKYDKIIMPFATLSAEEAYKVMTTIIKLVQLELTGTEFNGKQILKALKVALIENFDVETYLSMLEELEELTDCTAEMLNVMHWAIKKGQTKVYNRLLQIKSNFKVSKYITNILPIAIEYANTDIYDSLLKLSDLTKLRANTFLLHSAAQSGSIKTVEKFLELEFDPKRRDSNEWLPIHHAIIDGDLRIFNLLLPKVEKDLTEADYFNLFYVAAVNGRVEIMQNLMNNGQKLTVKNFNGKNLLESVNAKLNKLMETEKKYWKKIYSSFDKLHRSIKFLQDNTTPEQSNNNMINELAITKQHSLVAAKENTRLINNVATIFNNPHFADNLSLYDRHCNGRTFRDSVVIGFLTLFTVAICVILALGGVEKLFPNAGKADTGFDDQHTANILLSVGGALALVDVLIFLGICLPRNKIPCTHFFRHNPSVAERSHSDEQPGRILPLNNP